MSESHYRRAAALKCRTRFGRAIALPQALEAIVGQTPK